MTILEAVDKVILKELQGNLPIVERPFQGVAQKANITEEELFTRIRKLIDEGLIRKFGLRIDSKKVGYASTLVAMKVARGKRDEIAAKLNTYPNVTHNYAREHEYNLWFTIIARSKDELEKNLDKIQRDGGYEDMLNLPVLRKFKINVKFDIK
jgi:DNA-binding Lrp family transcriptional regulator